MNRHIAISVNVARCLTQAYVLLKFRFQDRQERVCVVPSTFALRTLEYLDRAQFQVQQSEYDRVSAEQPDFVPTDWDASIIVRDLWLDVEPTKFLFKPTLSNGETSEIIMRSEVAWLIRKYLREARSDLIDLHKMAGAPAN